MRGGTIVADEHHEGVRCHRRPRRPVADRPARRAHRRGRARTAAASRRSSASSPASTSRTPETVERRGTVGYLPQEPERRAGETLLASSRAAPGVAAAAADGRPRGRLSGCQPLSLVQEHGDALDRFLALGGGDLEARAREVCAELGLARAARPAAADAVRRRGGARLARGAAARALRRPLPRRADERPRLRRGSSGSSGSWTATAARSSLVSHDRAFLDRTVTRIVAFDAETRRVREFAGNYAALRARARRSRRAAGGGVRAAASRSASASTSLLGDAARARRARAARSADRRGTQALRGKVRQAERRARAAREVEKPWQPWRLSSSSRPAQSERRRRRAAVRRGRRARHVPLGPLDVDVGWGDRLAIVGRNGAGKTTLLRALTGELPLARGTRTVGTGVVLRRARPAARALRRRRAAARALPRRGRALTDRGADAAREVRHPRRRRAAPGRLALTRRAQPRALALLQARGVNCLILDEPTNHLDLEAIEQLERALADYAGTVLLVTHDRRFLERFAADADDRALRACRAAPRARPSAGRRARPRARAAPR